MSYLIYKSTRYVRKNKNRENLKMPSKRKCAVCGGLGSLWGTPRLTVEGSDFGLDVKCWRCLGSGSVPQDNRDEGETNG